MKHVAFFLLKYMSKETYELYKKHNMATSQ